MTYKYNDNGKWQTAGKQNRGDKWGKVLTYTPPAVPYPQAPRSFNKLRISGPITANMTHAIYQEAWKSDSSMIDDLQTFFRAVKYDIMRLDSKVDDVKPGIFEEIQLRRGRVLPDFLNSEQCLPTANKTFNCNIWYLIYRAMFPRGSFPQTEKSIIICEKIFVNSQKSYISRVHTEKLDEAKIIFAKRYSTIDSQNTPEAIAYYDECNARAIGEYKQIQQENKDETQKISDMIQNIQSYEIPVQKALWNIITLCPQTESLDPNFDTSILSIETPQKLSEVIEALRKITCEFYDKYPDFSEQTVSPDSYKDWLLLKTHSDLLTSSLQFFFSRKTVSDVARYDNNLIRIYKNFIDHYTYKPFNRVYYLPLGIDTKTRNKSVQRKINKCTEKTMDSTLAELSIEPIPTILEITINQMSMIDKSSELLKDVILRFYEPQLIRENLKKQYANKNDKGYTAMLATMFYVMRYKEPIKVSDYLMEFTLTRDDLGNVVLKLWDLRFAFPNTFAKIKEELASLLKKLDFSSFPPRIASLLHFIEL
jgi:hypothetical protein